MNRVLRFLWSACFLLLVGTATAQADRWEVRKGNKAFSKGEFVAAELEYRRALEKDSTSVPAHYNLSNAQYRQEKFDYAEELLKKRMDSIVRPAQRADAFHNLGNMQLKQKKYAESIASYKDALRLRPHDMETKSNLAYAQKMLKNQQDQQQDQDQDNQDQDNKDENQDNKDQDQDQNQDKKPPEAPPKITPQSAQQMLEAMQQKEKETQEKVNKEKAKAVQPVRSGKNW